MSLKQYLEAFEKAKESRRNEPAWLRDLREEGMASFEQKGFPTLKDEAWRYTDVAPIRDTAFDMNEVSPEVSAETLAALKQKSGPNFLLVVNGRFSCEHSSFEKGIHVMDLGEAAASSPDLVAPYLGREAGPETGAFTALNAGLFKHGLLIRVPEGVTVETPFQIVYLFRSPRERNAFHVRNLIVMGKNSEASILETFMTEGEGKGYFTNVVTEIVLEEGAVLRHCKVQREHPEAFHIAATHVVQRRESAYTSLAVSTGARLMRQDCRVELAEEGASCSLNGLYLGDREQLLDHQTFVDHQKKDGKSDQCFKGLWAGSSRGVFRGRVMVRQDAQRTDARQVHKSLLLSDAAKVDVQPQLEILADDVKCSHGAAVGQLQEDALFYLRSRGIGENEAARILAQGFAREVIERSGCDFAKESLLDLVNEKLAQQLFIEKE